MKCHTLFIFWYYTTPIAFVKYLCGNSMHSMNGTDFSCEFFYHCESEIMISQRKKEHLQYLKKIFIH